MKLAFRCFFCLLLFAISLVLSLGLWGASSRCGEGVVDDSSFRSIINELKGDFLQNFTEGLSDDLFFSDDFIDIYESPCGSFKYAKKVMSDPEMDEGQKLVAVISMQRLPAASYFDFSAEVLRSYRTGNLSLRVLKYTFFPNIAYSSRHQWYFWYPRWRELNREAAELAQDNYVTRRVEQKLNGEIWWNWMDERASRGFTPSRR